MEFMDERERVIAEQAVLAYRAVREAAAHAAFGRGLEVTEAAALEATRDHGRRLLGEALAACADAQKKGIAPAAAGLVALSV